MASRPSIMSSVSRRPVAFYEADDHISASLTSSLALAEHGVGFADVGKTYAMLSEGQRRREGGADVVVGFVECHGAAAHRGHDRRSGGHPQIGRASCRERV